MEFLFPTKECCGVTPATSMYHGACHGSDVLTTSVARAVTIFAYGGRLKARALLTYGINQSIRMGYR